MATTPTRPLAVVTGASAGTEFFARADVLDTPGRRGGEGRSRRMAEPKES